MTDSLDLADGFDKLGAHLRHSCSQVGCSFLDIAEAGEGYGYGDE